MKKILLLLTAVCFSTTALLAQTQSMSSVDAPASDQYTPSTLPVPAPNKQRGVGDPFPSTIGTKHVVGKTTYDLQTNGALQNRIMVTGTNNIHTAWTMSQETGVTSTSSYADRGTGYAFYNGTAWGAPPSARIEGSIRTGFGGMAINGNGNPVYVAHSSNYDIVLSEKTTSGWNTVTTSLVTSSKQAIWPDVATSDDWMYIICGAADSNSRTNGIRYGYYFSRSNDNGATWIDNAIPMPLVDSVGHWSGGGNSYSISARDSIVAVIFGDFGTDLTLVQSNDYGATWTKKVIYDWPIDNYYTANMTDTNADNIPDSIYSQDGSFDIAIDKAGEVHVAFPTFRMYNDGPAVAGYNFWAQSTRMNYYNSVADSVAPVDYIYFIEFGQTIALHHTLCDGDTVLAPIANYTTDPGGANYNTIGYLTMPQVSVNDDNNDVYITYSSIVDGDQTVIDIAHPYWFGVSGVEGQPYRDIMVLASSNSGASFGYPVNVSRTGHYEEIFPSVPERVTGPDLHMLYQGDIEPGTIMQNDDTYDPDFENYMIYQKVPLSEIKTESASISAPCNQFELPLSTDDVVKTFNGTVSVYPNPATDFVNIDLELDAQAKSVSYELYDLTGRMITKVTHSNVSSDNVEISVAGLSTGNYLLKVNADNAISSHKVSIQ